MTFGKWTNVTTPKLGTHCVPLDDIREHMDENCPCRPKKDKDADYWVHNSFDGREAFESGERKVS